MEIYSEIEIIPSFYCYLIIRIKINFDMLWYRDINIFLTFQLLTQKITTEYISHLYSIGKECVITFYIL